MGNVGVENYSELIKFLTKEIQEYIRDNEIDCQSSLLRLSYVGKTHLYKELMDAGNVEMLTDEIKENVDIMHLEIRVREILPIRNNREELANNPYIEYINNIMENLDKDILENLLNIELLNLDIINNEDKIKYIMDTIKYNKEEILGMFVGEEI